MNIVFPSRKVDIFGHAETNTAPPKYVRPFAAMYERIERSYLFENGCLTLFILYNEHYSHAVEDILLLRKVVGRFNAKRRSYAVVSIIPDNFLRNYWSIEVWPEIKGPLRKQQE